MRIPKTKHIIIITDMMVFEYRDQLLFTPGAQMHRRTDDACSKYICDFFFKSYDFVFSDHTYLFFANQSMVRPIPSSKGTFGSHPNSLRAREMSGLRCLGSSWGRGL